MWELTLAYPHFKGTDGEKVKLSFILMVTESFPLFAEPEWRIILEDPGVFHRKVIPK